MIFAIDFDGTICTELWPEIGEPVREVVEFIRELQERGDRWILYTMREGATLEQAVAVLAELGLRPDAINDNLPERCARFGNNPRKIYADIYIDDHNAGGLRLPTLEKSTARKGITKGGLK